MPPNNYRGEFQLIKLQTCDLPVVVSKFKDYKHSISLLASVHGFSVSELEVSISDYDAIYYCDDIQTPNALVSITCVDRAQETAQMQLCGELGQDASMFNFLKVKEKFQVRRLYSFVFPWETLEISSLIKLGFHQEAVFREHVYIDGKYQDLLVYGLVDEVS